MKQLIPFGFTAAQIPVAVWLYVWFVSTYTGARTIDEWVTIWFIRVILAVFLLGVCWLMFSLVRLRREENQLREEILRKEKYEQGSEKHSEDRLTCLLPEKSSRGGLVAQRTQSLWENASRNIDPQQDALREADEQQVENHLALPAHIASSSVLIGLLGTLYGLSLAVLAIITSSASATDFAALQTAVLQGLKGAKTAFYTSIGGILSMILLNTSILLVRTGWSHLLERANRFIELDLIPFFFQESSEHRLNDLVDDLERTISKLGERIDSLANAAAHIQNSFGGLISVGRSFEQGAKELLSLREDMKSFLGQSLELKKQYMESSKSLVDQLEAQIGLSGKISGQIEEEITNLKARQNSLSELEARFVTISNAAERLPAEVEKLLQVASEVYIEKLQGLNDTYLQMLGPTGDRLYETSEQLEHFASQSLTQLKDGVTGLGLQIQEGVLTNCTEITERVQVELSEVMQLHHSAMGTYLQSIEELKVHIVGFKKVLNQYLARGR